MEQKTNENRIKKYRPFRNHIYASIIIIFVVVLVIIAMFQLIYDNARRNVLEAWENNVSQMARSTEYYLARPADVIDICSAEVERMMDEGSTGREIREYLVREKDLYAGLIKNNYTGVYGYCMNEYMDASGWKPPKGYAPTNRPWYIDARKNKGKVTLVAPFRNLQSHEMMMSISKMLKDGKSVLSLDIHMDTLQKSIHKLLSRKGTKEAFIVDRSGIIIAHSNNSEVGKNYIKHGSKYQKDLLTCVRAAEKRSSHSVIGPSDSELVYTEKMIGGWTAALVLDESKMLSQVQSIKIFLAFLLVLTIIGGVLIFRNITQKYKEAEQLSREIIAVSDIFIALYMVDMKDDHIEVIRANKRVNELLGGDLTNYSKRTAYLATGMTTEKSRQQLIEFLDTSTYEERLRDIRSISLEYLNSKDQWARFHLVVMDRDQNGDLWRIVWAIELIDEERKRQEHFRKLAETDALSGLRNRRSGEENIHKKIESGKNGMFFLLDIDDFKIVNDEYGHDAGDQVISAFSDCLSSCFRDDDIVYRLGGDEFAAFITGTVDDNTRRRLIERIHSNTDTIVIPGSDGIHISISIGTTDFPLGADDSFDAMYRRADQDMYENKRRKKS